MSMARIFDWLSSIPDDLNKESVCVPRPKRRRLNPATPPDSASAHDDDKDILTMSLDRDESPTKRRIPLDDETPRPSNRKRIQTPRSEASYSLSEQSEHSFRSSQHSGKLSPQKHLQILKLNPNGLKFRDLVQFDDKPPALEALLESVDVIMEGKGIVASSAREALQSAARTHRDLRWALRGNDYFSDERDNLGPTPPPEDVLDVVDAAAECSSYGHPEANWNLEVHQRVLELAFRPKGQPKFRHLVNFMGSTTAGIIPAYGNSSLSKKVDFCIYVEPDNDKNPSPTAPSIQSSIASLQDTLPGRAFNFTDFVPLDQRPVALSIETKKPSEGFDGAKLQLGVWQMAHWSFLRHLVQRPKPEPQGEGAVQLPAFVPGIIIQGHDWHLNITTLEGQQTIFWQKVVIGSTSSSKGVYQIIHNLQLLGQWAKDMYWPWLREVILKG